MFKINSSKAIKRGIVVVAAATTAFTWGGLEGSRTTNKNLLKEVQSKTSVSSFEKIQNNSRIISLKTGDKSLPFAYSKANVYLQDVLDSLKGKTIQPFKKHVEKFLHK